MKMCSAVKRYVLALAMVGLVGCEWGGSGDSDGTSWNDRVAWVNFNGVYRAASGLLVTAYTDTTVNTNTPIDVFFESVGITDGTKTVFNGRLRHWPIVPGSLSIDFGGTGLYVVYDQGDGTMSGAGMSGTIIYGSGTWSVDTVVLFGIGWPMLATYQYTLSSGAGQPGSTKYPINLFTLLQNGNQIQFMDNNGAVYKGKISQVVRSSGSTTATPISGEEVTAMFEATGVSRAGLNVTMTGALTGSVSGSSTSFVLQNRRVRGAWVESKGMIGEISGQASPTPISGP